MEKVTRNITLDLSRKSNVRLVFATQLDRDARRLCITLTDDGKPYFVKRNLAATVNFTRPDGRTGAYLASICDDGTVEYNIDKAVLQIAGQTRCSLSLSGEDGEKLTSSPFVIDVVEALYDGSGVSEEEGFIKLDEGSGGAPFVTVMSAYPLGTIYTSVDTTSPEALFGGTWQLLGESDLSVSGGGPVTTAKLWKRTA